MKEIYARLADELNRIPNGFPRTESGVELKLLAKLFTPDDARLATYLSMEPQSVKEIALKSNTGEDETRSGLISMVKRGLIELKKDDKKGFVFYLIPFVVGFYERQNAKIDKEFAELTWDDRHKLSSINLPPTAATPKPFSFYYVRVVQEDGEMAWSSPIWLIER